jgi:hypothetical protein
MEEWRYSFAFSYMKVNHKLHAPAASTVVKGFQYHHIGGSMELRIDLNLAQKRNISAATWNRISIPRCDHPVD